MIGRAFPVLLGTGLVANVSLVPPMQNAPRVWDVVLVVFAARTLWLVATRRFHPPVILAGLAALAFLGFALIGVETGDTGLVIASTRFGIGILAALALVATLEGPGQIEAFLRGGALGALLVGFLALAQTYGVAGSFLLVPAGTPDWFVGDGQMRAVGIWQHPNELAQAQGIGAAMALALCWQRRTLLIPVLLFGTIVALTYQVTQTRALLAVSGVVFLGTMVLHPDRSLRGAFLVVAVPAGAFGLVLAEPMLGERWFGAQGDGRELFGNLVERLQGWGYALRAIADNPLGYGVEGRVRALESRGYVGQASHNGYLGLAISFGVLPAALALLALGSGALRNLCDPVWAGFLPVYGAALLLLMVEDSIFSSSLQAVLFLGVFGGLATFGGMARLKVSA